MNENLNKHYQTLDQETDTLVDTDDVIYNGYDKVQIKECIINNDNNEPRMIVEFTYYHTDN